MANNNEEQIETKQLNQHPKIESIKSPEIQASQSKTPYLIPGLSFIIAIVATVLSIYTMQLNNQLQRKLVDENANFSAQLSQLKQTQTTTQDQLDAKTVNIQQNQSDLQSKLDNLKDQVHTVLNQRLYQSQDWLLLKARYYLELAQINSYWSDNFKTTIALLQQADDLLKQLTEPKIFDVRQAIAKEITQIKAIPTVDVAGLLSQLDAAQISVNNLTIQSIKDRSALDAQNETSKTSTPSTWRSRLQNSVNLLEKLIVIRRDNEDIKPLISPLLESTLKESIRLNLQEAQWAILNNNPVVYQLALKQAIMNLKRVFNEQTQNTSELIKQLNSLQQIKLTQEKPVTGQALPLLNQVIETKELLAKPMNNNSKGENRP